MSRLTSQDWDNIYKDFEAPISVWDCGQYCAPYNNGEPVCCTTQHVIPVMFVEEWELLRGRTRLWHEFRPADAFERRLAADTNPDYCLMECNGAQFCERENRSLACRAFPFFPYITRTGDFIGLSYYWAYEDRCWVISNMQVVDDDYRQQFVSTFDYIFAQMPDEREAYRQHSASMRRVFSRWKRSIPLLHRDGNYYTVVPKTGALCPSTPAALPKFAPFDSNGPPNRPDSGQNQEH